jgi:nitrobenzene nitroreductase
MVVAGLSLGYADNNLAENNMPNHKLDIEEFVTFVS